MNLLGEGMEISNTNIEKLAIAYLTQELAICPCLNPIFNADDKILSWDGEIQLFKYKNQRKKNIIGRCPVQVKGHCVSLEKLSRKSISYSVSVDDLRVYQRDGGVLYFVISISEKDERPYFRAYYNEFLPLDIGNILSTLEDGQKEKSLMFFPLPSTKVEKERLITQFIRDRFLQFNSANDYPTRLQDAISKHSTYVFWAPSDFSFLGNNRPTYIYEKSKERKNTYFPVGRVHFDEMTAKNVPLKVNVDGNVFFDSGHVDLKSKGKIKAIFFNRGLSLSNINKETAKIRLTTKCTFDEYLQNLKFILEISKGKTVSIDGVGEGEKFDFDTPAEDIIGEISYTEKICELLQRLHVTKKVDVKEFTPKALDDLYYLYRAIVQKEKFTAKTELESVIGKYNAGPLQFLIIRYVDDEKRLAYQDGFDTKGMRCEMSDLQDNRYPVSIYGRLKKEHFLTFDNIYYPEILRSIQEVEYSSFYGNLVNCLILEMLDAYDESRNAELLDTTVKISQWLYHQEEISIYFLNMMQTIRRQREFTPDEKSLIMDYRSKETDNFMLAGFAAVLGNSDDYHYYLGKLDEDQRSSFLMYPITSLMKEG